MAGLLSGSAIAQASGVIFGARARRNVDTKNLGAEELGSVYESLLELHPRINVDARSFALQTAGGNERKTSGSYYTPSSLIKVQLGSALDPVLDEAAKKGADSILELKVCDPASGSGHFLIAAANPIVKRKDEAANSEYCSKRVILEIYVCMAQLPTMLVPAPKQEQGEIAVPDLSRWVTPLEPPPADPRAAHGAQ